MRRAIALLLVFVRAESAVEQDLRQPARDPRLSGAGGRRARVGRSTRREHAGDGTAVVGRRSALDPDHRVRGVIRVRRRRQRCRNARRTEHSRHSRCGTVPRPGLSLVGLGSLEIDCRRTGCVDRHRRQRNPVRPGHRRRDRASDRLPTHADLGVAAFRRTVHRRAAGAVRARSGPGAQRSRCRLPTVRGGELHRRRRSDQWRNGTGAQLSAPQDPRSRVAGQADPELSGRMQASASLARVVSHVHATQRHAGDVADRRVHRERSAHGRRQRTRRRYRHLRDGIQGCRLPFQPRGVRQLRCATAR